MRFRHCSIGRKKRMYEKLYRKTLVLRSEFWYNKFDKQISIHKGVKIKCQYLISAIHLTKKKMPYAPTRHSIPMNPCRVRSIRSWFWTIQRNSGSTIRVVYLPIQSNALHSRLMRKKEPLVRILSVSMHVLPVCCAGWEKTISMYAYPVKTERMDMPYIRFVRSRLVAEPNCRQRTVSCSL